MGRRRADSAEQREVAREMYEQGWSYRQIERELGVARSTLSGWLGGVNGRPQTAQPVAAAGQDPRRQLARELRSDGLLLREIGGIVGVSAGTVHRWVRDLPVPRAARPGGDPEHMHRMRRAHWDRVLAEREVERAAVQRAAAGAVPPLTPPVLRLLASVAYWCEGTKSKSWRRAESVKFINSDPGLVLLFLAFLRQEGIRDERLRVAVSIHEDADVVGAQQYWSDLLGVPVERFQPPWLKRHNASTSRKNVGEAYVGCLVIGVRESRELYQRIAGTWQGIMDAVAHSQEQAA